MSFFAPPEPLFEEWTGCEVACCACVGRVQVSVGRASELSLDDKRALAARLLLKRTAGAEIRAPLSEGQKALWFVCQGPEAAAYNTVFPARIRSAIDVGALECAVQNLVARHAALRTTFAADENGPMQVIRAFGAADFKVIEVPQHPIDEVRELASDEARRPFVLESGPLLRVRLFSRAADDHVLILVLHHLVQDGWSLWQLLDELGSAYQTLAAGEQLGLEEEAATYSDFVTWQAERMADPQSEDDWRFWRDRLAGDLPQLDLVRDNSAEPPPPHTGAACRFRISAELRAGLEALSREQGVTLNATLLSAFSVLLSRQTGQEEVLVGALAGSSLRGQAKFSGVVGYFVNPVLMRARPQHTATFAAHLRETHRQLVDALEHQDFPFSRIVERLQPERRSGRAPLAQAMFALQRPHRARDLAGFMAPSLSGAEVDFAGLRLAPFDLPVRETPFELLLDVFVTRGDLACSLRYATRLFADATIGGLAVQFQRLLAEIVRDPNQAIGRLPLVDPEERRKLLDMGRGAPLEVPRGASVQEWLETTAAIHADAPALIFRGETVKYGDLNRRANRLAHRLRGLGIGPGDIVAIALSRSIEMSVAVLGIFKSGGAYLPLDPEAPDERLRLMVSDSGAAVILTDAAQADRFCGPAHVVVISGDLATDECEENPPERGDAGTPAYVIYTSGSTGRPKGVRVVRRTLVNLIAAMRDLFAPGPRDTFLAVTSLAFDVSVVEIFLGLCAGSRIVIADRFEVVDGARLRRLIETYDPSFMQATPASWQLLLSTGWPGSRRLAALSAGEALSTSLGGRLMETCGAVWNLYGPTEATVYATGHRLTSRDVDQSGAAGVTIGRPLANMQAYILDANLEPVPIGAPGELFIGGSGVAEGYLRRPELTAERFISDPFSGTPDARLYRTGDLACWRADGSIEFRGRIDEQLKVRGHRIEPGEIEAVLTDHAAVAEAVVVAREEGAGDLRLVGYVALNGPSAGSDSRDRIHAELRERLARHLPEYMRPSGLIFLDRLPRTSSGKIARRALPTLPVERPPLTSAYVTPRSEIEAQIAAIWMDVLNAEKVGVHDNFFDLGGHSLLAVAAQTKLSAAIGRVVAPTLLLEHPTIHALAVHLLESGAAPRRSAAEGAEAAGPADNAEAASRIAIVGLACRVPGADSLEGFWRNLAAGVESISRFSPADLAAAGVDPALAADPRFVPAGGVLEGMDRFDARLFGYSARDAALMDPQQRVLLECAWEALEHAGYNGERRPEAVGVFAGSGINAYATSHVPPADPAQPAASYQQMLGNEKDYLATRIAYKLGLAGPCLTVQTACSTGLAAVHLACESLISGACDLALGGGVSLRLPSDVGYLFQDGMILSPDGHCRAFDARAQGTVPGSGAGVVVLKRLADALRDGDTIHAVICGSALNNDGARKAGFTAPSLEGQAAVVKAALERAGVPARAIGYVEAHGTGTPLGDPIEIAALTRAFRVSTAEVGYCALGSVKTNLGHLDAAAGVVGLIKAVLAVGQGKIPPSLNFQAPNPAIDFATSPFFVNTELRDWPEPADRRYAGVSAFGIGGANVHLVVSGAPSPREEPAGPRERPLHVLTLSAMDQTGLEELAARYGRALATAPEARLADVCHTANAGRRRLPRRAAIVGASRSDFISQLTALAAPGLVAAASTEVKGLQGAAPRVALLFGEDEHALLDFGRELYATEPRFRAAIDRCGDVLESLGHRGLARWVSDPAAPTSPEATAAGGFAMGFALADLWRAWGVRPDAVAGAGAGALIAGVIAGAIRLEDGLRLAVARVGLRGERDGPGRYADLVREAPSAPPQIGLLDGHGRFVQSVSPEAQTHFGLGPALRTLVEHDYAIAIAVGRAADAPPGLHVVEHRAERGVWRPLLEGLALSARLGVPVDWTSVDEPYRRRRVPWPTYPFARERHWLAPRRASASSPAAASPAAPSIDDPLLGARIPAALLGEGEAIFQAMWGVQGPAYLKDHAVDGRPVAPLTAYLQAALAAGRAVAGRARVAVRDLVVEQPLILDNASRTVQAVVRRREDGGADFTFYSRAPGNDPDGPWLRHASARLGPEAPLVHHSDLATVQLRLARQEANLSEFDARCRDAGVVYGPSFRSLARLWLGDEEALGELNSMPDDLAAEAPDTAHPAWIDAGLQVMGALLQARDDGLAYRPIGVGGAQLLRPGADRVWCHARLHKDHGGDGMVRGDLDLYDADGVAVGRLDDVEFRAARSSGEGWRRALYEVAWRALPALEATPANSLLSGEGVRRAGALTIERAEANRGAVALLEELATEAMATAMARLGGDLGKEEILGLEHLIARLGVVERHRPLVLRMLEVLETAGRAKRIGVGWRLQVDARDLAQRFVEAEAHPDILHELKLLRRASESLAGVLQGREDPLEVLFPRGDFTDTAALYERSLPPSLLNGMVLAAVEQLILRGPGDRRVRILEIGAGTGATAARLLAALPAGRFEYVYTDVSPAFLNRARNRFAAHRGVDYRLLDVEVPVVDQGFAAHSFDIVIAANVLHTARDLNQALRNVHDLLTPGGALLAVEANAPRVWADVVFGVTDGWWRFQAAERGRTHALLPMSAWREHLAAAGFKGIEAVEPGETYGAGLGHVLLAAQAERPVAGPWLVLAQDGVAGRTLVSHLERLGARGVLVEPGPSFAQLATGGYRLDLRDGAQLDRLFAPETLGEAPAGVVRLWPPAGAGGAVGTALGNLEEALSLTQAVLRRDDRRPPQLALVTCGAQATGEGARVPGLVQAPLWGLGKTIMLEHPELACRRIDLDPDAYDRQLEALARELLERRREPELALRDGMAYAPRLIAARAPPAGAPRLRADGVYLITGGARGLGLRVAEWMCGRGARDLVLVGRRPLSAEGEAVVRRLRDGGVQVRVRAADVTREADLRAVLDEISGDGSALRGVVHAAGALDDGVLLNQSPARFAAVMGPKAAGAWHLHRLTADLPVEAFVVFSSIASLFGARAQANHAAANAFVDALCAARRAAGLPAVSINWGPWRVVGAAAARDVEARGLNRGVASFDPETALEILARAWDHPAALVGAAAISWPDFLGAGETPPFFREIQPRSAPAGPPLVVARPQPPPRVRPATSAGKDMTERVAKVVGQVLGVSADALDPRQGLFDMGLDSLGAITLRHALQDEIGQPLPATVVFRFSTIEALVGRLLSDASDTEPGPALAGAAAAEAAAAAGDPEDWEGWSEADLAAALARELGDANDEAEAMQSGRGRTDPLETSRLA